MGNDPLQSVLRAINVGTVMMCFQVGYYFWRRVPADRQSSVMRCFLGALDDRLASMSLNLDALLDRLLELQPATVAAISQSTT